MIKTDYDIFMKPIISYIKNNASIRKHFDFTYHAQKYSLVDILKCIFIILHTGLPWSYINVITMNSIKYGAVYCSFKKLHKFGILKNTDD